MSTMQDFDKRAQLAYEAAVGRGEHDEQCEWGPRQRNGRTVINYICNCSKRRREREGYTTPPGELIYKAPSCPRCYDDVHFDGDVWVCRPCRVHWVNGATSPAEFTDDYGDLGGTA